MVVSSNAMTLAFSRISVAKLSSYPINRLETNTTLTHISILFDVVRLTLNRTMIHQTFFVKYSIAFFISSSLSIQGASVPKSKIWMVFHLSKSSLCHLKSIYVIAYLSYASLIMKSHSIIDVVPSYFNPNSP